MSAPASGSGSGSGPMTGIVKPEDEGEDSAPVRDSRQAVLMLLVWIGGATLARGVGVWVGIGSAAIVLGGGVLLTAAGKRVRRQLRPTGSLVALGLVAALVMIAATELLYPLAARLVPAIGAHTTALYGELGKLTPFKLTVIGLVILGEETVWRGVVQGALSRRFGVIVTVATAAIAYGVGHIPAGSVLLPLVALACGLYWSALTAWTGSLVPALIAHLLWDLTVLAWAPLVRMP